MKPILISPKDFELRVKRYIELSAEGRLEDFRAVHRDILRSPDGEYEIDITARFRALAVAFLVLIECKYHSHPIKRDVVQVLYAKIESTGAQKGILFSVSPFQKGAIHYAQRHGIALAQFMDAGPTFETRTSEEDYISVAPSRDVKLYIPAIAADGSVSHNPRVIEYLSNYLGHF
jgi:restriction system protein